MPKHGTILLIEDDSNDVLLLTKAFTQAGITQSLEVAHTAPEALKYLGGEGKFANRANYPLPFLVLLDLRMPGDGGFAILRWLYERPGLKKKFSVIVLSGSGQKQEVQLAYELGVQSYLSKPLDFKQLTDMVRRIKGFWIDLNILPEDAL